MKTVRIGYLALSKLSWRTARIDKIAADTAKFLSEPPGCRLVQAAGLITSERRRKKPVQS